ncbi:hypothetical protein [Viridibacillus arvi]|uniref:hypothetical protein n=1 Tax=Viridibacillus arvi TaxID=263475 RepID=UPI003CFBEC44
MVKELLSQHGLVVLVDDEIHEQIKHLHWTVSAINNSSRFLVHNRKLGCLSRLVSGLNDTETKVTFKDNNSLNLQRSNLIIAKPSEIARKTKGRRNTSSKYKGVCWNKRLGKWHARIGFQGKKIHLGFYIDEEKAAERYNEAALKYFGENCYLNKIGQDNSTDTFEVEKDFQGRSHIPNGYRGIQKEGKKWSARIYRRKKTIYLGMYSSKIEAAKAYDKKAYELFGEKAILNFPNEVKL